MVARLRSWLSFWKRRARQRYWEKRARRYGPRSVLHLGHSASEFESVTRRQKDLLFPLLQAELHGDERVLLDFGAGPGRFTADLASLISGRAIGVDPTEELLALAPGDERVEYHTLVGGRIPLEDSSCDVIWTCLVLGCITDGDELAEAARELHRVLRPGGLLFLVENTSERAPRPQIRYRSVSQYQQLLRFAKLRQVGEYEDLGERISVLAGR